MTAYARVDCIMPPCVGLTLAQGSVPPKPGELVALRSQPSQSATNPTERLWFAATKLETMSGVIGIDIDRTRVRVLMSLDGFRRLTEGEWIVTATEPLQNGQRTLSTTADGIVFIAHANDGDDLGWLANDPITVEF